MRRTAVSVFAGAIALAVAATWPLARHITTHLPHDLADPVLNTWILAWDAHAIAARINVWNAPILYPYDHTLAYTEHLLGFAWLTAPIEWWTRNPVFAYNVAFVVSYGCAALGMYLLAHLLTGSAKAAIVAAAIYAFAPYRVAQVAHIQWLMVGWLPLALWALHRYFQAGAWYLLAAAGAAYAVQTLSSSYFAYYALVPLGIVAVAELWRVRPPPARTALHAAIASAVVAAMLVPVVRVYTHVHATEGLRRAASEIEASSADLSDYFRGHSDIWLWRHAAPGTSEHEWFPGMVALTLTSLAIVRRSSSRAVRVYGAVALVALVFSLGPHPAAWGHVAPIDGPYQLLLRFVPGLDGLRAISRLGVIVLLAIAVLAACGAAAILSALSSSRRWAMTAALLVVIVGEGWAAPIRTVRFQPLADPDDNSAYEFLRSAAPGVVLELPMSLGNHPQEMTYQYLTLVHGHPLVNGDVGYETPLGRLIGTLDQSPFTNAPARYAVGFVRGLGIRYIVFHRRRFSDEVLAAGLWNELEHGEHVVARHVYGDTGVFTLAADPEIAVSDTAAPLSASALTIQSSNSPDRVPFMLDGDVDTRWLTGARQNGNEWIDVALDRPRDVAVVRLQTAERSLGDYPRALTIEAVEDSGTRTLFDGSVLPALGRAFRIDRRYPPVDIALAPNRSRIVRLRQRGSTKQLFWSIHELQLWERRAR
jgi:hypothetical protein